MLRKSASPRFDLLVGYAHVSLCVLAVSLFYFKDLYRIAPLPMKIMMGFLALVSLPQLILTALSQFRGAPFRRWSEGAQVMILVVASFVTMPAFPTRSYCILLIYMAFFLAGKYGFLTPFRSILMILAAVLLKIGCIMLGGPESDGIMFAAFHLFFITVIGFGYWDGVLKSRERNAILRTINDSLKEEILNKHKISDQLAAARLNVKDFSFTPAEKEILELMCFEGITSNREIAEHLNKSVSTVKTQLYSIFEKTGIHKRSKLIAFFRDK